VTDGCEANKCAGPETCRNGTFTPDHVIVHVLTLHGVPLVASLLRPTNVRRVVWLLMNAATIACQTTAGAPRGEADVVGTMIT
jgi:hypothetical protein